jgi:hypothetical protein
MKCALWQQKQTIGRKTVLHFDNILSSLGNVKIIITDQENEGRIIHSSALKKQL